MSLFDTLPIELLVHIFSYLSTKFLLRTVVLVCKQFDDILKSERYWKARHSRYGQCFPVELERVSHWQLGCAQFEVLTAARSKDPSENSCTLRGKDVAKKVYART